MQILIVEPSAAARHDAVAQLIELGHNVVQAADAAEGLLMCDLHPREIDTIIVNTTLPRISGYAFAFYAARLRPGAAFVFTSETGSGGSTYTSDPVQGVSLKLPCSGARLIEAAHAAVDIKLSMQRGADR